MEDGVAVPTLASVLGTLQPQRQTVVEAHNFADTSRYKTEQELTAAVDALSRTDSLRLAPEVREAGAGWGGEGLADGASALSDCGADLERDEVFCSNAVGQAVCLGACLCQVKGGNGSGVL